MIPILRMVLAILFLMVVVPVAALFAFPWTLITRKIGFLYWNGMTILRAVVWITGTKVEVRGLDKIDPSGTYVFMSNHASNLDPAILMRLIPRRTSVLVKKEMWRIPIIGPAFDLASLVPVERSNRAAAIESIRRAGEVMRKGINMMLYPEGTRSTDGRLLPFKKGPFHLAAETGFPIVPVTMLGTFEMMPKGKFAAKGGTVAVVFHPPIDPKKFSSIEELIVATENAIRSALPKERQ
jgi:1-acyl-sn-glycerol-3-phosphate acyltransferase